MRNAALILERFDSRAVTTSDGSAGESVREQRARAEGYAQGLAAGEAQARTKYELQEAELAAAVGALRQIVADAPDRLARDGVAALKILIESLFPALARAGFAIEAADAIARVAAEATSQTIEIAVSPGHAKALGSAISKIAPEGAVKVHEDASLQGAAAYATWSTGGLEFDLDKSIRQCVDALERAGAKIDSERNK